MSYRYDGNGQFTDEKAGKSAPTQNSDPWASQPQQKRSGSDKPSNSDVGSWIFIAIMFAVAWPIGLIMLISKLGEGSGSSKKTTASKSKSESNKVKKAASRVTKSPKDTDGTARVLKIVGICLAAVGALACLGTLSELPYALEYGYVWQILEDLFVAGGFLAAGGGLLWGSVGMKRRMRRFAKYLAAAGNRSTVSISRLAALAEVSTRRVEKDLDIMIEKGLWGEDAYVDLGAGKLFRTREAADNHYQAKEATEIPPQAQQGYSGMLRQIRAANDRIADPELSEKIDRIEELAGKIFRIIEREPEKKAKASTFLNYYLPTTQKLLDSYAEFEETGISGENLSQAKQKIERTMDNIVRGFERQLDELYRSDALDIDSDIRVMETMLRRDRASVKEDFGLGGGSATQRQEYTE